MSYAATDHIGDDQKAHKAKAAQAAQANRRIPKLDAASQGCSRSQTGTGAVRTAANAADVFLRTTFLPKLEQPAITHDDAVPQQLEESFYQSLERLNERYGFIAMETRDFPYPYNMALGLWQTESQLRRTVKDYYDLQFVQDEAGKMFLMTEHRYDTGTNLYYIPVIPLYRMLKDKTKRKTACLLLSLCSYLYHLADIPYYRQEHTYLFGEYDMLQEWVTNDPYEEEEDNRLSELEKARWVGDVMERKLFSRKNLEVFAERIQTYKPVTVYEQECLQLATQMLLLYEAYPDHTIFKHGHQMAQYAEDADEYDEDEREIITMDKYISFVADTKGWLYDELATCVNNEFNECTEMEEPMLQKRFDGSGQPTGNLDFEDRLFALINDLCYLLQNN